MFSEACRNARGFTHPLVMCKKLPDGKTGCGIGAFFFVNRDGYAVTVSHVFKEYLEGVESGTAEKSLLKVTGMHGNGPDTVRPGPSDGKTQYGFWFGDDDVVLDDLFVDHEVDIAVLRLSKVGRDMVRETPVFRDPKTVEIGTSVCRMGFPFVNLRCEITDGTFRFYGLPMPFFSNDGMHARSVNLGVSDKGFDRRYVETTTPGMRGQSGGPIFDTAGRIYAMQSRTEHIPLGFEVGNQFMNIGMGVHGGTIRQVLDARKVDYLREEAPAKKMGRFFH